MPFRPTRNQLAENLVQPVHRRDPQLDDLLSPGRQHPQNLDLVVRAHQLQVLGSKTGDSDRVGVRVIGLAAAATTEGTHPRRQPCRHVEDRLALRDQPLRKSGTDATSALDRPDAITMGPGEGLHRPVTSAIIGEPLLRQHPFLRINDDQRVARLVRIDTDHNLGHEPSCGRRGRRGGQSYFRRSTPLLSHSQPTTPGRGSTPLMSHTKIAGSQLASYPTGRLTHSLAWPRADVSEQVASYGTGGRGRWRP
jgi:hypothetical protein